MARLRYRFRDIEGDWARQPATRAIIELSGRNTMQPCAICGSVSINADGYCAQCGTFRGTAAPPPHSGYPPAQSGYPGHAQPTSSPGYPTSGSPGYPAGGAPGYPVSGAAGYPQSPGAPGYPSGGTPGYPPAGATGYPTSGAAPGYPTSSGPQGFPTSAPPAGYPTAYPPPGSPRPKRSMLVPLAALAATLVVLVVGIGVVLAVRDDEPKKDFAGPTRSSAPPTSSASKPAAADCLVGTWEVTSYREEVTDDDFGKVIFRGGDGVTMTYSEDGSGRTDYGSGTEFKATVEGKSLILELKGAITYRYKATTAKIKMSEVKSSVTYRVVYDGEQVGQWDDYEAEDEDVTFSCSGDRMTQKSILHTAELERAG
ncbi:MAG TPA: hypothetical protein VFX61_09120 [Micromonosporaceae bacterium]|nr:hypothetical protein [Micromonosporaceae bacterium]